MVLLQSIDYKQSNYINPSLISTDVHNHVSFVKTRNPSNTGIIQNIKVIFLRSSIFTKVDMFRTNAVNTSFFEG